MAMDYERARKTALKLIKSFGGVGTVVIKGMAGGFDDNGDALAATADTSNAGFISPLNRYKTSETKGKSILSGDCFIYFQSNTPLNNVDEMQITVNSKVFRIIDIWALSSVNDIEVVNKLQLRR